MEVVIVVVVIVGIMWIIRNIMQGVQDDKRNNFRLALVEEFPEAKYYFSGDNDSFLFVDFPSEQIIVGVGGVHRTDLPFSDIVKVEILRDGSSQTTSTNRGSQLLGAAVGAVAFGGVGAIIGGLSGSSTTTGGGVSNITLQITTEDIDDPIHEVTFYENESEEGGKRGQQWFDESVRDIAEFASHLDKAIRTVEASKIEESTAQSKEPETLAGAIGELWKLKEAGALTQEEFDVQKVRLMGKEK